MALIRRFIVTSLLLSSLGTATSIRADTLDTIIDVVLYAVEPSLVQAKPMVKCLVQGSSVSSCTEQFAAQQADDALADAMASDPKITLIVDIVKSAQGGEWITVLELTGTDLLVQIACSTGMPGGGPVKSFICSELFSQVAGLAKPVVSEILTAIKHKDWMKLVGLAGPGLACEIIPSDDPVSGTVCTVLGKVIGAVGGALVDAAGAIIDKVGDLVEDESPHISYDEYYARKFSLLPYKRALQRIMHNRQGLGLDPAEWNPCVDYFDSHQQARDTAEKTCNDLGRRLHNESEVLTAYVLTLPQTHFDAYIKPTVKDRAADLMMSDAIEAYKGFVDQLPPENWNRIAFLTGKPQFFDYKKGESILFDVYKDCSYRMDDMIYGQGQGTITYPGQAPESLLDWACYQAAGHLYAEALIMERLRLMVSVQPKLVDAGCDPRSANFEGSVVFKCSNYAGHTLCTEEFKGYQHSHCSIDVIAATRAMGEQIAQMLGDKRCTYLDETKYETFDPRVVCRRPWKKEQCDQLLAQQLQQSALQVSKLDCKYFKSNEYKQALEQTKNILQALNTPDSPEADGDDQTAGALQLSSTAKRIKRTDKQFKRLPPDNCTSTWDPLTLHCKDPKVLYSLSDRLPGVTLPTCAPDLNQDGADLPCYGGAYAIDPVRESKTDISSAGLGKIRLPGAVDVKNPVTSRGPIRDSSSVPTGPGRGFAPIPIAGRGLAATVDKPAVELQQLPDQVASPGFTLGGKSARWGVSTTLNATSLVPRAGGCQVPVKYGITNKGPVMNPAASNARWSITGHPPAISIPTGRIKPGETVRRDVSLTLYPGENRIELALDPENRVTETNESNNLSLVAVRLTGQCASQSRHTSPGPAKSLGKSSPGGNLQRFQPLR
ncbi:MAG: CARDB domain-containing protein [Candidatus Sedimenticola sp. PURPLELP]